MARTKQVIHFEVYTLRSNKWELYARYLEKERKAAIQDAKKLEKTPGIEAAKVVRDTYDLASGTSTEETVFKSFQMKQDFIGVRVNASTPAESHPSETTKSSETFPLARQGSGVDPRRGTPRVTRSKPSMGRMLSAAIIWSVVIATLSAGGIKFLADHFGYSFKNFAPYEEPIILAVVFLIAFVSSFSIVLHRRFRHSDDMFAPSFPDLDAKPVGTQETLSGKKASSADVSHPETEPSDNDASPPTPLPSLVSDVEHLPEAAAEKAKPPKPVTKATAEASAQLQRFSAYAEKQMGLMTRFVSDSTKQFDTDREGRQADSAFRALGISFYLAGAAATLAERRTLDYPSMVRILRESLELAGRPHKQAGQFVDNFEEDLLADARNAAPYEDGKEAMIRYLDGDASAADQLAKTIEQWMSPNMPRGRSSSVTIVFVDVERPDKDDDNVDAVMAQNALHTRNRLVRDVLRQYNGTEIKHTGPGIMASFPSPHQGLEAAVIIQRKSAAHNQIQPDLPVRLRIGISTGDPEDADPFLANTSVIAAWASSNANYEQIVLSEKVKTVCAPHGFAFQDLGLFKHAPSGKTVPLFEAVWKTPGYLNDIRTA